MSDHHTCEAVAVHCIDFRFQKAISEYLALKFPEGYDRISVAGGVKNILEQREESIVVKNTQISSALHASRVIVLLQHEDCGAYGGSKGFESKEQEIRFHTEEMEKAKEILTKRFPHMEIQMLFASLSGQIQQPLVSEKV